jgi:nitrate/TMAO reductase-like tetraheme cytochrome c subunit
MKSAKLWMVLLAVGVATFLLAAGIYAGTTPPDVTKIETPYELTKGAVEFSHQKHASEYKNAKGEAITCGECHHDDKGKPLALKEGDDVKKCFECHNQPGELKGKDAKGKPDSEVIKYHANALHKNCIDCHKDYNKANKTKAAPATCTKCHPKK